jgi:molybdopterin-guanine dinucleotide biosynthesis protein A
VRDWDQVAAAAQVAFPAESMANLNTPADLAAAEARL